MNPTDYEAICQSLIAERLNMKARQAPLAEYQALNRVAARMAPQNSTGKAEFLRRCGVPRIDIVRLMNYPESVAGVAS